MNLSKVAFLITLTLLIAAAIPIPATAQEITPASQTLPLPLTGIAQVSAGADFTCAITSGGGVKCWGFNFFGQLGNGNAPTNRDTPVNVTGLSSGVEAVSAGGFHTCALTTGGAVKCWGDNFHGQLGDDNPPTGSDTPINVVGLTRSVTAIAAGGLHACALTTLGGVKCWGDNAYGQLGDDNAPNDRATSGNVMGLTSGVTAIAAGAFHTCALTTGGGVKCWGRNGDGQLGDANAPTQRDTPGNVVGLGSGVTAIAAGGFHTCALTTGGGVKCWGLNFNGQLGDDNAPNDRVTPGNVTGLTSDVTAITAGANHTCARVTSGVAQCWGDNAFGQLGDGDAPNNRDTPGDVVGLGSGVIAITAGSEHTCARITSGGVKCWGENAFGQLGDGTFANHSLPADVLTPTICYELRRNHTGNGVDPSADPAHTPGCPASHYLPGQIVTLLADPAAGFRVNGWSGTANNTTLNEVNYLTIPADRASDRTVSVTYAECHALTRNKTGSGADPIAAPDRSDNCPENTYVSGETLTLIAKPNANQRIQAWSGADTIPFTGETVNTLTMPNQARTITAAYETCFALAAVIAGQGEPLTANPASSTGCAASAYVAGESITLAAAAASGWSIQSWSGTANNASTAPTNQLTMPTSNHIVGVTYVATTQTGSVSGMLYADANGNAQPDVGEGLAGVSVTLQSEIGMVAALTVNDVTDAEGAYGFADVPVGNYTLRFAMPAGYAPLLDVHISVVAGQTVAVPQRKAEKLEPGGLYLPALQNQDG